MNINDLKNGDTISLKDYKKIITQTQLKNKKQCIDGYPTESIEQQLVAQYLDSLNLLWCHVPNGGARYKGAAGLLKAEGVKAGVPDILIFTTPPKAKFRGVAIELKRQTGGQVSPDQKRWLNNLEKCNWITTVCHGYESVIEFLKKLGYEDENQDLG